MPGLASLSKALLSTVSERKSSIGLYSIPEGVGAPPPEGLAFQYFPASINDTKSVHYSSRDIPGASLPIYQWVNSGERKISFTAQFSSDTDLVQNPSLWDFHKAHGVRQRNIDIRSAISWLRQYMLPNYGDSPAAGISGVQLTVAPKKLMLYVPNSGIGLWGGQYGGQGAQNEIDSLATKGMVVTDIVRCFMSQCDVNVESLFPSGLPRLASVQLSFTEIAQYNGGVFFPSAKITGDTASDGAGAAGSLGSINPYPIKVTFWKQKGQ